MIQNTLLFFKLFMLYNPDILELERTIFNPYFQHFDNIEIVLIHIILVCGVQAIMSSLG